VSVMPASGLGTAHECLAAAGAGALGLTPGRGRAFCATEAHWCRRTPRRP
jgi:hypothetical protein